MPQIVVFHLGAWLIISKITNTISCYPNSPTLSINHVWFIRLDNCSDN